jgi:hypothetical protein
MIHVLEIHVLEMKVEVDEYYSDYKVKFNSVKMTEKKYKCKRTQFMIMAALLLLFLSISATSSLKSEKSR